MPGVVCVMSTVTKKPDWGDRILVTILVLVGIAAIFCAYMALRSSSSTTTVTCTTVENTITCTNTWE
jgi:hypothetical protein